MAAVTHHAAVSVYSTQVKSHNGSAILVEAGGFTPMRWFLERAANASLLDSDEDTEPVKKKRKITRNRKSRQSAPTEFASGDLIPIRQASIDLHFDKRSIDSVVEFDETNADVSVILHEQSSDESGSKLKLALRTNKSAVIDIDTSAIAGDAYDLLLDLAPLDKLIKVDTREWEKAHPATVLKCTVRLAKGPYPIVRLEASLSWRSGVSAFPASVPVGRARVYDDYDVLIQAYPNLAREEIDHSQPFTPQDFYGSVHVPPKDTAVDPWYDRVLDCELYPFQKRAVTWMLRREGVQCIGGQILPLLRVERSGNKVHFYDEIRDANDEICYVNHLQGIITRERPVTDNATPSGGLLAEEMGLGKTVEMMALISLHKQHSNTTAPIYDTETGAPLLRSKATLIITPNTILPQWKGELSRHAPALSIYHYQGIPGGNRSEKGEKSLLADLATRYDVVLVSYQTLGRELNFVEDPPDRGLRHAPKFERKRSPLVQIFWFRVCLDEAQMVEPGVTAAAKVARRLNRQHSWCVTGTPLRNKVEDLHGLLIFLHCQPFSDNAKLWGHLVTNHRHLFKRIFRSIAMRHTKSQVRDQLQIPQQKRIVMTMSFSAIEQQAYTALLTEMCEAVGVHDNGSPKIEDWDPKYPQTLEAMRTWLVRLRQSCLHPQVGGRNRKALGGKGPLKTVAQVLELMIDQNETNTRLEERALLASQLLHAHVVGNNGDNEHRAEEALQMYRSAMTTSAILVKEARERLAAVQVSATSVGVASEATDDEDSANESTPILGRLRTSLRTVLQLQHVCTFFAATAIYQIKTNETLTIPDSSSFQELEAEETAFYDSAKALRKEILRETARKAEVLIRKIQEQATSARMPQIQDLESLGGIENRRIVERSDELFDVIREVSRTIVQWRAKMAAYLVVSLVDADDGLEITGDEYEASTKEQDELYVYFDVVKALHHDLTTFVTGENQLLIDIEMKTLEYQARKYLDPDDDSDFVVHAPELALKLVAVRKRLRAHKDQVGSVRGLIAEARALENSMQPGSVRAETERVLVQRHLVALQKVFVTYTKVLAGLQNDIDLYRSTQNQRIAFYKQLQELSDAVAPYKEDLDEHLDWVALEAVATKEAQQTKNLALLRTKHRYLLTLRQDAGNEESSKMCVICQSGFENGVLTVCGHTFCSECIHHWFIAHRSCPVCKRKLNAQDMYDITYRTQDIRAHEEGNHASSSQGDGLPTSPNSQRTSIYSTVDSQLLNEIKAIDLPSSYGSKIDGIGRHLHWIREHDPGAKSIIFSQYREFLDILGTALADFRIGYSRLGRAGAVEKFRGDASIDCLLVDAKTDSSGLTLINATHVFLCEPLIQTAIELQAIARVHRIGQTRPTTIWMYLIGDTVEEAIYEISVARRLEHVQSGKSGKSRSTTPALLNEGAIEAADSAKLEATPLSRLLVAGKGGGELVGNEDLWQCLFGKARKQNVKPSVEMERAVARHLRGEAAALRQMEGEGEQ